MRIVVSAFDGKGIDAQFSPIFGRCQAFVFVDTETMACETVPNRAVDQPGGAGIQAAQDVVNRGAQAVITGSVGPNAHRVLTSAGVQVFIFTGATVRQAIEAYKNGLLQPVAQPTAAAHAGMGMGGGMGGGRGMGRRITWPGYPPPGSESQAPASETSSGKPASNTEDIAALKSELQALGKRLSELTDRIEEIEGKK